MSKRPGFQYPFIRKADPETLNPVFKNYGDNLRWLSDTVESLQVSLANVKEESAVITSDSGTSGVYQPLAIAGVNVDEAVASQAQWLRIGNIVAVSGVLVVTPSGAGLCNTDLTLPFASHFTDRVQLAGTADEENGTDHGSVLGNTLTFNANVEWTATGSTAYNLSYIYIYQTTSHVLSAGAAGGGTGGGGGGSANVSNAPYGPSWNGIANIAPSQNAVYDKIESLVAASVIYGSFIDTTTQVSAGTTSVNTVTFNSTEEANGVSIVSNSRITVSIDGIYNIEFSLQMNKTGGGGTDYIDIWLSLNGTDIPASTGRQSIPNTNSSDVPAWNYTMALSAGDYVQFKWSSPEATMQLKAYTGLATPTRPDIPSAAVTVSCVGITG